MAKEKKTLSAKSVRKDLKLGLSNDDLMEKYQLSSKGLRSLLKKMADAGLISPDELQRRSDQPRVEPESKPTPPKPAAHPIQPSKPVPAISQESPVSSTFIVKAASGRKGDWCVFIYPDFVRVQALDGSETFEIMKSDAEEKMELRTPKLIDPFLVIMTPKRVAFKLDKSQAELIEEWLGPINQNRLAVALKRRFAFCIAVAIFIIVTSFPMGGDPKTGINPIPADYIGMALGISLLGLAVLAKFWPRPILFLFDSFWFAALAAKIGYNVYQGQNGIYWLIFAVIIGLFAIQSLMEFRRYTSILNVADQLESGATST
jgi:hypothetical protein